MSAKKILTRRTSPCHPGVGAGGAVRGGVTASFARVDRHEPRDPLGTPGGDGGPGVRSMIIRALGESEQGATVSELLGRIGCTESSLRRALSELSAAGAVARSTEEPTGRGRPSSVYRLAADRDGPGELLGLLVGMLGGGTPLTEADITNFGRRHAASLHRAGDDSAMLGPMSRLGFGPRDTSVKSTRERGVRDLRFESCPFGGAVGSGGVWAACALHRGILEGLAGASDMELVEFSPTDPITVGCVARLEAQPDSTRAQDRH